MERIKKIVKFIGITLFVILWFILCVIDPKAAFLLLCAAGIWSIAEILDKRLPTKIIVNNKVEINDKEID